MANLRFPTKSPLGLVLSLLLLSLINVLGGVSTVFYSAALPDLRLSFDVSDTRGAHIFLMAGFGGVIGIICTTLLLPAMKSCAARRDRRHGATNDEYERHETQNGLLLVLGLLMCSVASVSQWLMPLEHRLWAAALAVVFALNWSQAVCSSCISCMTASWGALSAGSLTCVQSGYSLGALATPFLVGNVLALRDCFLMLAVWAFLSLLAMMLLWKQLTVKHVDSGRSTDQCPTHADKQLPNLIVEDHDGVSSLYVQESVHEPVSDGPESQLPRRASDSMMTFSVPNRGQDNEEPLLLHPQLHSVSPDRDQPQRCVPDDLRSCFIQVAVSVRFWYFFLAIAVYVGTESCLMAWIDRELKGLGRGRYSDLSICLFWAGSLFGRLTLSFANLRFNISESQAQRTRLLRISLILTVALASLLIVFLNTTASLPLVALVGTACAPCFPLLLIWGSDDLCATVPGCGPNEPGVSLPVSGMLLGAAAGSGALVEFQGIVHSKTGIRNVMLLSPICALLALGMTFLLQHSNPLRQKATGQALPPVRIVNG